MLEKLGVKNLTMSKNQDKQHKSRVIKKQEADNAKKTKWLTEVQVLTKDST